MGNTSGHATMKLVSSQRIPAKTVVILKGQIDCGSKFTTPDHAIFNQTDLQVENALILPDDNNKVKVTVCNSFNDSQHLEAELDLGEVESCCSTVCPLVYGTPIEVPIEDIDGKITSEAVEMSAICKVSSKDLRTAEVLNTDDRKDKLKRMLDLARGTMSQEEMHKIVDCAVQAHDVFSLQKSGWREVVDIQHAIDTGDSPPVRQGPRRILFALRAEVTKMVEEMLATGVIEVPG